MMMTRTNDVRSQEKHAVDLTACFWFIGAAATQPDARWTRPIAG